MYHIVMSKRKILLLDGKAILYRGYYAFSNLRTKDGRAIGAIYGFLRLLIEAQKKFQPDQIICAWDPKGGDKFRRELYREYKAQRKRAPEEFYEQIIPTGELIEALGVDNYTIMGIEADDVIGSLNNQLLADSGVETIILTSDRDFLQLISDKTQIALMKKGLTEFEWGNFHYLEDKYQFSDPKLIIFLKSLMGDSSDNIPGVIGVGPKTALRLISQFHSLENLYQNLDEITPASLQEKLIKYQDLAELSYTLATIRQDLDIDFHEQPQKNLDLVISKLEDMRFKSLIKPITELFFPELTLDRSAPDKLKNSEQYVLSSKLDLKKKYDSVYIDKLSDNSYLIFIIDSLSVQYKIFPNMIKCQDFSATEIIGFDLKTIVNFADNKKPTARLFDLRLVALCLDSSQKAESLEGLSNIWIGDYHNIRQDSLDLLESQSNIEEVVISRVSTITKLEHSFKNSFKEESSLEAIYSKIEAPLIPLISKIENIGISFDYQLALKKLAEIKVVLEQLTEKIRGLAGEDFNLNSPSQLKRILFDKLKISEVGIKKNKSGLSTAALELDKLSDLHPIINLIIEYREVNKLYNTYFEPLPKIAQKVDGNYFIHTTYNQIGSASGRFSSVNPNLQNIPTKTELGKEVRKLFIARQGQTLLSADYSQIELRIAAELSRDPKLIEAFQENLDIHSSTASLIFDTPLSEVSSSQRRISKAINFGIIYGMNPYGLSIAGSMSTVEAAEFIGKYFKVYSKLKQYLEFVEDFATKHQYTETLWGRRRYCRDISSGHFVVRQAAKRAAINFPFQGGNADIIKKAMLDLSLAIPDIKILLQIHDELIFEIPDDSLKDYSRPIKEIMENVTKLIVPLEVNLKLGKNWSEL